MGPEAETLRLAALALALIAAAVAQTPLASAACEHEGTDVAAPVAAGASVTRSDCTTTYEGGFGDWWYRSHVHDETTTVAVTTDHTGTSSVWVKKWNETIAYGDGAGSGEQYGDWIEAGHSTNLDGGWRYQSVKLGTAGWEWADDGYASDTDMVVAEFQLFDSGSYWHRGHVVLQRFDIDSSHYQGNDCHLLVGSTLFPVWLAELLAESPDPPYAGCAAIMPP